MNELEKWGQAVDGGYVHTIQSFIEFLQDQKIVLHREPIPLCGADFQNLVYQFFNVDPIQLEKERRALIESFRKTHTQNLANN